MPSYGSDKDALGFGLEISDIGDIVPQTQFKVFLDAVAAGGKVRGINVKSGADKFSSKGLDDLAEFVKRYGAKGLAWIKVEAENLTSPIEKFLPAAAQQALRQRFNAEPGDLLLFVADSEDTVCQALGNLRVHLANVLKLFDPEKKEIKIFWIVEFPLFLWDK